MSTHSPGHVYLDWHIRDRADATLQAELAHDQVRHPVSEYAEGSPKWLALWEAIAQAKRWPGPRVFIITLYYQGGSMTVECNYQIGDIVASVLHVEDVRKFLSATDLRMRPQTLRGEERLSMECKAGTQLYDSGRTKEGGSEKHAEDILVNAEFLWDVWLDGILKQQEKKAKP